MTSYGYDEQGRKIRQTDALGRTTRWSYDDVGREVSRTLPGNQRENIEYDGAGHRTAHIDFNNQRTTYTYDDVGRLIRTTYADGRVEQQGYDDAGNRTSLVSPEGAYAWRYDARNRMIEETQPHGVAIEYEYDAAGNRVLIRDRIGLAPLTTFTESHYAFNERNQLVGAQLGTGTPIVYSYDLAGNRVGEMQGDLVTTYVYDARHRLIDLRTTHSGVTLQRYHYTVDATGRRTRIDETDATGQAHVIDYTYDDLGRLTGETETVGSNVVHQSSYSYDHVGNRTGHTSDGVTVAATFDVNDRMLMQGGESYGYDANGNQVSKTTAAGTVTYGYDARGRMVEATDGATGARTQFDYDGDGNKIEKRARPNAAAADITTRYVVDRNLGLPGVLAEVDPANAIGARYLHALDLAQQTTISGGIATTRYPLRDGLGSTRYLASEEGVVSDAFRYSPWGEQRERQGTTPTAHRFAGEVWDDGLQLSYNRARWYAPSQGRFTQADAWIGSRARPITLNKFLYADADPAANRDPTGYFSLSEATATIGIAAALYGASVTGYKVWTGSNRGGAAVAGGRSINGVWDIIAATLFRSATVAGVNVTEEARTRSKNRNPDDEHHTVPIYLCGAVAQRTSSIDRTKHGEIHAGLATVEIALIAAEESADRLIPLKRRRSDPILSLAESREGRAVIGAALEEYYLSLWWRVGTPTIGEVFPEEKKEYVAGKTSLPQCKRKPDPAE